MIRTGIIQQHNTADIQDNMNRLANGIAQLAKEGAQLIVLQELHNSLYFCQEEQVDIFDLAEPIPGPSTRFFGQLAKEHGVVIVTSLFETRAPGLYHNTAVVTEKDGSVAGIYRKMHIPDDPAYYEKFYFTPGDLGFQPIDTSVGRLGVLVCWDQWYPEAARLMAMRGANMLIYPTAIGYAASDDEANAKLGPPYNVLMPLPMDCPWWQLTVLVSNPTHPNKRPASTFGVARLYLARKANCFSVPTTPKSNAPSST